MKVQLTRCQTGNHVVCELGKTSQRLVTHSLVGATKDVFEELRARPKSSSRRTSRNLYCAPSPRQNEEAPENFQMATLEAAPQGA